MVTVRGAITVGENTKADIIDSANELLKKILEDNNILLNDIISIIFTSTSDLDEAYPAVAAREFGLTSCGLMCMQEMEVKNSLKKCIRILIFFNSNNVQADIKHVYLKDAKILRPDLMDI